MEEVIKDFGMEKFLTRKVIHTDLLDKTDTNKPDPICFLMGLTRLDSRSRKIYNYDNINIEQISKNLKVCLLPAEDRGSGKGQGKNPPALLSQRTPSPMINF